MTQKAQIIVTYADLAAWLRLPDGCVVTAAAPQDECDLSNDRIRLIISGTGCPQHYEGAHALLVGTTRDHTGRTFLGG